jgi:hypothetical protein
MHQAGLTDLKQEPAQFKLREPRDMRITGHQKRSNNRPIAMTVHHAHFDRWTGGITVGFAALSIGLGTT